MIVVGVPNCIHDIDSEFIDIEQRLRPHNNKTMHSRGSNVRIETRQATIPKSEHKNKQTVAIILFGIICHTWKAEQQTKRQPKCWMLLLCSFERKLNRTAVNGRADDYLFNTTTPTWCLSLVFVTSIVGLVCERLRIAIHAIWFKTWNIDQIALKSQCRCMLMFGNWER